MFEFITKYLPSAGPGKLPPVQLPKAPNSQLTVPCFKTQVSKATAVISQSDRALANTNTTTYRTGTNTRTILRDMVASSQDLSATVNAYLRVGIPSKYTVLARDMDGQINPDATKTVQ